MKTLSEHKDEVSFEMFSVPYDKLLVLGCQLNVLEEAAKRFAREACKEQREICALACDAANVAPSTTLWDAITNAPEPNI